MTDNGKKRVNSQLNDWYTRWIEILEKSKVTMEEAEEIMKTNNPVVIPRNHHVEALLASCEHAVMGNSNSITSDSQLEVSEIVNEFLKVIRSPYQEIEATKNYQDMPEDNDQYYQTFCGT